jgi:hypothetical protein
MGAVLWGRSQQTHAKNTLSQLDITMFFVLFRQKMDLRFVILLTKSPSFTHSFPPVHWFFIIHAMRLAKRGA